MKIVRRILVFVIALAGVGAFAQGDIPVGTWRMHASYTLIRSLAVTPDFIYGAALNGVMVLDRAESSISTLTRLDGLQGSEITGVAFDETTNQLLVIHEDGTFDVVKDKSVLNYDPAASGVITGSKTINSITLNNNTAYLSTDYGVLLFDLTRSEIRETWRNIGDNGEVLPVYQSTIRADSIFLATENGVIAGDLDDNLLDFHLWKRFEIAGGSVPLKLITTFDSKIFVNIPNDGIYSHDQSGWVKEDFLNGMDATAMATSANNLVIADGATIYRINTSMNLSTTTNESIANIMAIAEDAEGRLWVGDASSGIVSLTGESAVVYTANGPAITTGHRLRYHDKKIFMLSGGFNASHVPLRISGTVSVFEKGIWSTIDTEVSDITDVEKIKDGTMLYSSFGYGVKVINPQNVGTLYDENNSTLINSNPPGRFVNVTSMVRVNDDVWVTNYAAANSLHKFSQGNWELVNLPYFAAQYPLSIESDYLGRLWVQINPEQGGGLVVYNPLNSESRYLIEGDNNGELPSRDVYAIEEDRDGYVWVGTDRGAAYFFDANSDAVRPIMGNNYLLSDDRVTSIKVDGGNRKWMGTLRGVWLINPSGEGSVEHFTIDNSPLPSNVIVDIEVNPSTGEVFFLTDRGLVSYRGDATEARAVPSSVKIFPNPVTARYNGRVGISGVAMDAAVKITDVTGKLVWQGKANGGSISWDVTTAGGRRVSNGVYLVFAATDNSAESMVGKVAVID